MVKGSVGARRELILTATANLIRRDGVAALTTKRVAAEAGCAEGTIFRHFGDKGGLIAAVLSFGLPEIDHLEQVASRKPSGDLVVDLTDLCAATLDFYRASYPIAASALTDATIFQRYRDAHNARGERPSAHPRRGVRPRHRHRRHGGVVPRARRPPRRRDHL